MEDRHVWGGTMSSIMVPEGLEVDIFSDYKWEGEKHTIHGEWVDKKKQTMRCVDLNGDLSSMNNYVYSMKVRRTEALKMYAGWEHVLTTDWGRETHYKTGWSRNSTEYSYDKVQAGIEAAAKVKVLFGYGGDYELKSYVKGEAIRELTRSDKAWEHKEFDT